MLGRCDGPRVPEFTEGTYLPLRTVLFEYNVEMLRVGYLGQRSFCVGHEQKEGSRGQETRPEVWTTRTVWGKDGIHPERCFSHNPLQPSQSNPLHLRTVFFTCDKQWYPPLIEILTIMEHKGETLIRSEFPKLNYTACVKQHKRLVLNLKKNTQTRNLGKNTKVL